MQFITKLGLLYVNISLLSFLFFFLEKSIDGDFFSCSQQEANKILVLPKESETFFLYLNKMSCLFSPSLKVSEYSPVGFIESRRTGSSENAVVHPRLLFIYNIIIIIMYLS